MRSRHVGVTIARPPEEVYAYASDPRNLPTWAAGLAEGEISVAADGELTVDAPMGPVRVHFVPRNAFGVLDHVVTLPDGATVLNPLRVLPHPDGSEVVFTLRQLGMDDDEFERDAGMVTADLARLKDVLAGGPGGYGPGTTGPSTPPSGEVRVATPADAASVARMLHDFNAEFDAATPSKDVLRDRLGSQLGRDDVLVVVAGSPTDGDVGFGLLTLRPTPYWEGPLAQLEELYIRPDRRGEGVGTALLDRALAEVRARGGEEMHINVDFDDTGARRFYARHGFSDVDPDSGSGMRCYLRQV